MFKTRKHGAAEKRGVWFLPIKDEREALVSFREAKAAGDSERVTEAAKSLDQALMVKLRPMSNKEYEGIITRELVPMLAKDMEVDVDKRTAHVSEGFLKEVETKTREQWPALIEERVVAVRNWVVSTLEPVSEGSEEYIEVEAEITTGAGIVAIMPYLEDRDPTIKVIIEALHSMSRLDAGSAAKFGWWPGWRPQTQQSSDGDANSAGVPSSNSLPSTQDTTNGSCG